MRMGWLLMEILRLLPIHTVVIVDGELPPVLNITQFVLTDENVEEIKVILDCSVCAVVCTVWQIWIAGAWTSGQTFSHIFDMTIGGNTAFDSARPLSVKIKSKSLSGVVHIPAEDSQWRMSGTDLASGCAFSMSEG